MQPNHHLRQRILNDKELRTRVNLLPEFVRRILRLAPLLCFLAALTVSAQSVKNIKGSPAAQTPGFVHINGVESSEDLHEALLEKPALQFSSSQPTNLTVRVDESRTYQQIDGFGASITDSPAWLLSQKLMPAQRTALLRQLFDTKQGVGLAILRQPMGSSDFSVADYGYDDLPPGESDPELKHFTIDRDRQYILPVLREALAVNPKLKITASPWSPPGWMKTSGSMIGGTLLPSSFTPLARYFVRFVQSYEAAGVPIFAITPQNEPRNLPGDYPGMGMTAEEQTVFIREHLGPAFRNAHLKTKIMAFDHNWDMIDFPDKILSDPKAAEFSAGTATHCYGGGPEARPNSTTISPQKASGSRNAPEENGKKATCLLLRRISLSKRCGIGGRVSFCGTSPSIKITRRIWVVAQTAAA